MDIKHKHKKVFDKKYINELLEKAHKISLLKTEHKLVEDIDAFEITKNSNIKHFFIEDNIDVIVLVFESIFSNKKDKSIEITFEELNTPLEELEIEFKEKREDKIKSKEQRKIEKLLKNVRHVCIFSEAKEIITCVLNGVIDKTPKINYKLKELKTVFKRLDIEIEFGEHSFGLNNEEMSLTCTVFHNDERYTLIYYIDSSRFKFLKK